MHATNLSHFSTPRAQRWFIAGLVLFFIGLSVQYTIKITCSERESRSAILRWNESLRDIDDGINIYDKHNYPNPPIMALLLKPLAELPPLAGSLLWFYLKVGMVFLVFRWVFRLLEEANRPLPTWAKALIIVFSLRPIMGDLSHGNVNIFILFLVVAALYSFQRQGEFRAGLLLALAIACKVTPALFLPYFLWKRAWKTLLACAAGLVLFLGPIPGLFLGQDHNAFLFHEWVEQMIVPYVVEGEVTSEHQNQSLPGLLYRLATHSPSFSDYDDRTHSYVPVEFHNIVDLNPVCLQAILKICMAFFALLVVWSCRTDTRDRQQWRMAAEFSVIVLGMLLFSERTWKHHCVTLILPFGVIIYYLSACRPTPRLRRFLLATLILATLLIASTSTGVFGKIVTRAAKLSQVYGAYVWAYVLLTAAMIVLLRLPSVRLHAPLGAPHLFSTRLLPLPLAQPPAANSGTGSHSNSTLPGNSLPSPERDEPDGLEVVSFPG